MSHFQQHDLFGGKGRVDIWDLLQGAAASPFTEVVRCRLQGRGRVGAHRQQNCSELVIALQGQGRAWVDGQEQSLSQNQVAFLPWGAALELENLSDEPFDYLIVKARPMAD